MPGAREAVRPASLRLLVVDDQEIAGIGLRVALCSRGRAQRCVYARDLGAAIECARRYDPRVALVGKSVAGLPGSAISRKLIATLPHVRTLLLTDRGAASADEVREAGAWGSVGKDWPAQRLVEAICSIANGERVGRRPPAVRSPLSPQQLQVLRLMAGGATNREIAASLAVSPHTIKQHAAELFRRLGARNRAQAVQQGQRMGLIV